VNFPSIPSWNRAPGTCRILCVHHNIRGVLREIDDILSAYNVGKQLLETKDTIGYLVADVKTDSLSTEIVARLAMLANTIRTRIV
jgi:D-3-phosphoglycerate dehydrogenase